MGKEKNLKQQKQNKTTKTKLGENLSGKSWAPQPPLLSASLRRRTNIFQTCSVPLSVPLAKTKASSLENQQTQTPGAQGKQAHASHQLPYREELPHCPTHSGPSQLCAPKTADTGEASAKRQIPNTQTNKRTWKKRTAPGTKD